MILTSRIYFTAEVNLKPHKKNFFLSKSEITVEKGIFFSAPRFSPGKNLIHHIESGESIEFRKEIDSTRPISPKKTAPKVKEVKVSLEEERRKSATRDLKSELYALREQLTDLEEKRRSTDFVATRSEISGDIGRKKFRIEEIEKELEEQDL